MPIRKYYAALEDLYARYNRREYVHPDPLEFLYAYEDLRDREIVGLVAAALALGRVRSILRSVRCVLDRLGSHPATLLEGVSAGRLRRMLADFRHRFVTGEDVAALLWGARGVARRHGSLQACFAAAMGRRDKTILPALGTFVEELVAAGGPSRGLLAHPCRRSACKRLNLYLRWMVRSDAVDPGGWRRVPASRLVIPLDTHMHRIGLALGLTARKQANLAAALEMTAAFRKIVPEDPVRYDFALTRLGIRSDAGLDEWLARCRAALTGLSITDNA
jgi:uncharacterized protein (TIGR02757 family)